MTIEILSPIDGEGYGFEFPRCEIKLDFGEGAITTFVQDSPADILVCIDYDADVNAGRHLVRCRGLLDSGGFEDLSPETTTTSEGRHTFVAWLRPRANSQSLQNVLSWELEETSTSRNRNNGTEQLQHTRAGRVGSADVADGISFGEWSRVAPRWVASGSWATAVYFTTREELHLRVLSPEPHFAYGGGSIPSQLQFGGVAGYTLCIAWDYHSASAGIVVEPDHNCVEDGAEEEEARVCGASHRTDDSAGRPLLQKSGCDSLSARRLTAFAPPECHELKAGEQPPSFVDSPSPQDMPEGPKLFRAWLERPRRRLAGESEGQEQQQQRQQRQRRQRHEAVVKLAVEVPYSTYRLPSSSAHKSRALNSGVRRGKPYEPNSMTSSRVIELWKELGLGGFPAAAAPAGTQTPSSSSSPSPPSPSSSSSRGSSPHPASPSPRSPEEIVEHRRQSMAASLNPEERFRQIPGLGQKGMEALLTQLHGNFDFGRALAAADFAHWCRLPRYNCSRPRSVLSTDPRDLEVTSLLDLNRGGTGFRPSPWDLLPVDVDTAAYLKEETEPKVAPAGGEGGVQKGTPTHRKRNGRGRRGVCGQRTPLYFHSDDDSGDANEGDDDEDEDDDDDAGAEEPVLLSSGQDAAERHAPSCQTVTAYTFDPGRGVGDLHFLLHRDADDDEEEEEEEEQEEENLTDGGGSVGDNRSEEESFGGVVKQDPQKQHRANERKRKAKEEKLPGEPFDLAIVSQTLEHLFDPVLALRGIFSRLAPGGFLFTSCPALSIPHMEPFHFASFTPMGLAVVLESAGFQVVELGLWGNADYAHKLFMTKSWPSFSQLEKPVTNDPMVSAAVWALAWKPSEG